MTDRYGAAGVHFDVAEEAKRRIGDLVRTTRTALALGEVGAFGGMVRLPPDLERPVLVLSTDGVGTKVLVAARAGVHDTVGDWCTAPARSRCSTTSRPGGWTRTSRPRS